MNSKIKIAAICGSTRTTSSNSKLIHAIAELSSDIFEISVYEGLTEIPHFNPDLDNDNVPKKISEFRTQLRQADAILICTPEYAMGVPGTLKNALDWTVSSMEFSKKPVALITASLSGEKAHASLLATLLILESKMTEASQLLISFIKTKVNDAGKITDEKALQGVQALIASLHQLVKNENVVLLTEPLLPIR